MTLLLLLRLCCPDADARDMAIAAQKLIAAVRRRPSCLAVLVLRRGGPVGDVPGLLR